MCNSCTNAIFTNIECRCEKITKTDDKINSKKIYYLEKYTLLVEHIITSVELKTRLSKKSVLYGLISVSELEKIVRKSQEMIIGYEDDMNTGTIDYHQKYNTVLHLIQKLIKSKTKVIKNDTFYDLIQVSELRQILDGVAQK